MDPKGFSDFIAKHGQIVGVEPVKKSATDLTTPQSYIYKFADGATVQYTPAVTNPQTGEVITPVQFIPDESVPVTAERKAAAASQGTNTNVEIRDGQKITTETPSGSAVSSRVEPAPANAQPDERKAQQNVERKRNSEKYGIPFDDIELREWQDAKEKESRAVSVQEKQLALQERKALEDAANTKWQQDLAERKYADDKAKDERDASKPTIREDPNNPGKFISIIPDPSQPGGVRITSVAAPGTPAAGQGPSLEDLQLQYGQTVDGLKAYAAKLQQALQAGQITQPELEKRWTEAKAAANTKVAEWNNIISTQANVYGQEAGNWRQQQATANTRLNASVQTHQLGVQAADKLKGLDPSGTAGMGTIMGTLARGRMAGEMFGGYANDAPPQRPAALQTIMEMDLNSGKIIVRPGGGAQSSGGMPQMPASIEDAVRADVTAAAPGRDFTPPTWDGGGMNFSGGQLRAPGYTAPQMPVSAIVGDSYPELRDAGFDDDIIAEAVQGMYA